MKTWMMALLGLALALGGTSATAQERILAYHSLLEIQSDGSLEVTETIRVRAEGRNIRRGIYRDFPTRYRDRAGNRVRVAFEPLEVLRDGQPEPWFTERRSNGVRVNTGDDRFLAIPGEFEYTLRYRTTRQLGFFDQHDELYWNVTGSGWEFAIGKASAEVRLPSEVPAGRISVEAYTGPEGATGQAYVASTLDGRARFETTAPLGRNEGLTIVVGFPKGLVDEPSRLQRVGWLLHDNRGVLVAGVGFVLLLAFYLSRWRRHGRDPEGGPVFPHYDPPQALGPAAQRYLRRMKYDDRCFTADVVDLAVQGHVQIRQDAKEWSLHRVSGKEAGGVPPSQAALLEKLFKAGDAVVLRNTNAATIGAARTAQMQALAKNCVPRYFVRNLGTVGIGVLGWLLVTALALVVAGGDGLPLTIGVTALGLVAHVVFAALMHARTGEGRRLLDQVEGLRLYMGVAEKGDLGSVQAPRGEAPLLDAGRYERLLPYAIALDVEQAWTKKFTLAVGAAAAAAVASSIAWYHGRGGVSDLGRMSRSLGSSLNSSISSSARPPGSSSGGGGGGSSGGGGGGGGGGGR